MTRLRSIGCPVPSGVLTLEQAIKELLPLVRKKEADENAQ